MRALVMFILFSMVSISGTSRFAVANASADECEGKFISTPAATSEAAVAQPPVTKLSAYDSFMQQLKAFAIDKTLSVMALSKGLPKYIKRIKELKTSGRYLEYRNFGQMGMAELEIPVRYSAEMFAALNTGRPLIIVANHPLGIVDGLALQHISSSARTNSPSLLYLARWVENLLPFSIYGSDNPWGTAIPVEINKPRRDDPEYELKMAQVNAFNSSWSRTSLRVLRSGGALIIFPAGHVASINKDGSSYPANVYDAPGEWMDGVLNLARLGKADLVFAHVDSVNSEAFYKNRKRFGGGDKERKIWFFSEALAMKGKNVDVHLSAPMSLDATYNALSTFSGHSREKLESDSKLAAEVMRQYTYQVSKLHPQTLDTVNLPPKISTSN